MEKWFGSAQAVPDGLVLSMIAARGQDLSYGPPQSPTKTWNGAGTNPDPNSPASQPFPSGDTSAAASAAPEAQVYSLSKQRVLMKDVLPERSSDGGLAIASEVSISSSTR
jgi:hypothetical protein